jgi:hypothetical protein
MFERDAACLACLYQPKGPGKSATEQAADALGLTPERAALLWVSNADLTDDDITNAAARLGVEKSSLSPWRGKRLGEFYTDVVCGAVAMDVGSLGRLEMVPLAHQSALAGVLMMAEVIKRAQPDLTALSQSDVLVSYDDILRPPPTIWTKPRAREPRCICGDQIYQNVFHSKWDIQSISSPS